jgi:5'-methylthioadenosine phosphorylase
MLIGIIAGSGLYELSDLEVHEIKKIKTPFGEPSDAYRIGRLKGFDIAFLPRHGTPHRFPPHRVNYRANIWGFKELGAERLISISAVGGISDKLRPGDIVILDQIIDMTGGLRVQTFYDNEAVHVDFTEPYCPQMRESLLNSCKSSGSDIHFGGTYIAVNGPRLETKAEIAFFKLIGGDVVGMTAMPEAVLARELELCLLGISVVTNYAAGISKKRLTTTEVVENMRLANRKVFKMLETALPLFNTERTCPCKDSLKEARL